MKLKNVKNEAEKSMTFTSGVLEMHVPYAMGAHGMFSDGEIRQLLEKNL